MARFTVSLPSVGDTATVANFNAETTNYTTATTASLNGDNVAPAAFDLPQFVVDDGIVHVASGAANMGTEDPSHNVAVFDIAWASPVVKTPLQNALGADAIVNLATSPITIGTDEVLQVYWNFSAHSVYDATIVLPAGPWGTSNYFEPGAPGATGKELNSAWCWVAVLQYATSQSAGVPTGWTEVPGQSDFLDSFGSAEGAALEDCPATVVIPTWQVVDSGLGTGGDSATMVVESKFFTPVSGAYFHNPASPLTVYGFRVVVLSGLYHPYHYSGQNVLIEDPDVDSGIYLRCGQGNISYLVTKES